MFCSDMDKKGEDLERAFIVASKFKIFRKRTKQPLFYA
jgi:hypothetical protein